VENNEYGIAIAYSTVLIGVMLAVIGLMQLAVGSRNLGRRKGDDPQAAGWRSNVSLPGHTQPVTIGGG
jgi:iron(III) transport system permease protein